MSGWGISPNASEKEKKKAEMADYIHGLNSCGMIDYSLYSELFDVSMTIMDEIYQLGEKEKRKAEMTQYLNGLNSSTNIEYSVYSEMYDISMQLLDEMYELGKEEALRWGNK